MYSCVKCKEVTDITIDGGIRLNVSSCSDDPFYFEFRVCRKCIPRSINVLPDTIVKDN